MAKWIPVGKRLPKPEVVDGEIAWFVPILFALHVGVNKVCAGRYVPGTRFCWRSLQGTEYTNAEVSHWMPLPAPPSVHSSGDQ